MFKNISLVLSGLFISTSLQAAITITPADIQQDGEGYYYLYELTFNDLSISYTTFENDVDTVSNITVHKTPPAIPPATPNPRWVCATTGENKANFKYVFDFSGVQLDGLDVKITSVELRDKLVMQNNSKFDEDSQIHTSWSVNGTVWNTFNSALTPAGTLLPVTTVQTDTLAFISNPNVFYYRASFENFDSDGFDENLNMWNYLASSQTDHFYVMIRLDYDFSTVPLDGDGTSGDPFLISTPEDLIYLGEHTALYDRYFLMTNDIDMTGYGSFTSALIAPDGDNSNSDFDGTTFSGNFNGNGYIISNLSFSPTADDDYMGLFGYVDSSGQIDNLGVENISIPNGHNCIGSLAGWNSGTLLNCYANGFVNGFVKGYNAVGVLVGKNQGILTGCSAGGSVRGSQNTGGLVGNNGPSAIVENCYASSYVSGYYGAGGLAGENYGGTISDCSASSSVNGHYDVGGIAGENHPSGVITNCSTDSSVTGYQNIGGLVGHNYSGSVESCSSVGYARGTISVGGLIGFNVGDISNCYTYSTVGIYDSDYYYVGGLLGYNTGAVVNSYSANRILIFTSSSYYTFIGAFVGKDDSLESSESTASYTACFWDTEVSDMTDAVGQSDDDIYSTPSPTYPDPDPAGITGLPTATMKVQGLYTSQGWDFIDETTNGTNDIWAIIENVTYPRFASECIDPPAGDVNGDCKFDLLDFAQLSEDWLKCGLMDEDLCP